jgi:hypothetical protein
MVVTACANVATPTPAVRPTSTNIPTPTLIPLTPTASPTVEPSPTVDPNMPVGKEGSDAIGNYVDAQENGQTVRYYEQKVHGANGELESQWGRLITPQDIPLFDLPQTANDAGNADQGWIRVFYMDKGGVHSLQSITHPSGDYSNPTGFVSALTRYLQTAAQAGGMDSSRPWSGLQGDYAFNFTGADEKTYTWQLGSNRVNGQPTQIIVDIRNDYDAMAPTSSNGFFAYKDYSGFGPTNQYHGFMYTDEFGNLHLEMAPQISEQQLTQQQIVEMILYELNILSNPDQQKGGISQLLSVFILNHSLDKLNPYFVISQIP